jgi:chromosome segregation ATPase
MTEQIIIWALGILSTLFGGLNIFQWITLNSYKRLKSAEAYQSEINSLRVIIETNQAEIGRLSKRLEAYDRREIENNSRYDELYRKYDQLRDEFEEYKLKHK